MLVIGEEYIEIAKGSSANDMIRKIQTPRKKVGLQHKPALQHSNNTLMHTPQ